MQLLYTTASFHWDTNELKFSLDADTTLQTLLTRNTHASTDHRRPKYCFISSSAKWEHIWNGKFHFTTKHRAGNSPDVKIPTALYILRLGLGRTELSTRSMPIMQLLTQITLTVVEDWYSDDYEMKASSDAPSPSHRRVLHHYTQILH
jgi:hypothetical protein